MKQVNTIGDVAALVRAKNAGPFWLTLDIFAGSPAAYEAISRPGVVTPEAVGAAYRVEPATVQIFCLPDLQVVKVSFPRPVVQGSFADRDMHSGQQSVPLADLPLDGPGPIHPSRGAAASGCGGTGTM